MLLSIQITLVMSSRVGKLRPLFVEYFPDEFESGILYVSMKYAICGHLCACGCGEKVITPLSPKQWKIAYNGEDVTLYPSIGNYAFACQSHYFLTNGNIIWVGERDVEKGKRKKKGLLAKLFNSKKDKKNGNKTRSKKDCKIHR